jgi:signal transduction histidine kinase
MFRSIRWRLVLSYVLLTLLTVTMVGVLALSLIEQYVGQQETEHLSANADAVARRALPLVWPIVRPAPLLELAQTSSFLGNARIRILDSRREALADSWASAKADEIVWILPPLDWNAEDLRILPRMLLPGLSAETPYPFPLLLGEAVSMLEGLPSDTGVTGVRWRDDAWGVRFSFHGADNPEELRAWVAQQQSAPRSERVVTVPIGDKGDPLGYVEISNGPDYGREALATARQAFLLAAGGATLLAVIVGLWVSRRLSAPLRELASVAGQMSSGDLTTRAPDQGRDEIGQLASQFNQMAERLEASFTELAAERDALRRFIADASHELRTPITALKSFNELLQGAAARDPDARAEFLSESQAQIDRLNWITRNLLDLSRLDAGLVELDLAVHDVGALLQGAALAFQAAAREKRISLSLRLPEPPVTLLCDQARLEMALSNLLDNALKYTPAGGQVDLGAHGESDGVHLWVRDDGPGIEPGDLPHVFERFYRGRNSRGEGSGLGLSIVHSIVQAHGGRLSVESTPSAGSLFLLVIPLH